jgi:transcriptional regulator with XRE-family HTH domain
MPVRSAPADMFAAALRHHRTRRGLTLAALADRAGLAKNAVWLLEDGRRRPTWDTVCRLADALNISVARFCDSKKR